MNIQSKLLLNSIYGGIHATKFLKLKDLKEIFMKNKEVKKVKKETAKDYIKRITNDFNEQKKFLNDEIEIYNAKLNRKEKEIDMIDTFLQILNEIQKKVK